jgi:uncharacterized membrane protein YeaQ/YmgE (transglycosylase-associated protein family)
MSMIAWVLLGLASGALGVLLLPRQGPEHCFRVILAALAGAALGGLLGALFGLGSIDLLDTPGTLCAVSGSIVAIGVQHYLRPRSS